MEIIAALFMIRITLKKTLVLEITQTKPVWSYVKLKRKVTHEYPGLRLLGDLGMMGTTVSSNMLPLLLRVSSDMLPLLLSDGLRGGRGGESSTGASFTTREILGGNFGGGPPSAIVVSLIGSAESGRSSSLETAAIGGGGGATVGRSNPRPLPRSLPLRDKLSVKSLSASSVLSMNSPSESVAAETIVSPGKQTN